MMIIFCIQDGNTALLKAAQGGHTKIVDRLVLAGADVNIVNNVSYLLVELIIYYHTYVCVSLFNAHIIIPMYICMYIN